MAQSVATARIGSFRFFVCSRDPGAMSRHRSSLRDRAAVRRIAAPIFMSCPVPGRALAVRSNMMLRRGASSTTGPRACRSRMPRSTYSKHGSATCSTNCSGRRR